MPTLPLSVLNGCCGEQMQRNLERFRAAARGVEVGKISGAVGNFANIPPFVQDMHAKDSA